MPVILCPDILINYGMLVQDCPSVIAALQCIVFTPILTSKLILSTKMSSADNRTEILTFFSKKIQNWKFQCHIWNQHRKCIQMSTNKPSIGPVVLEKNRVMFRKCFKFFNFCAQKLLPACKSWGGGGNLHIKVAARVCLRMHKIKGSSETISLKKGGHWVWDCTKPRQL